MEVKISHTTTLKGVVIKDTNALTSAVNDLIAEGVNCSLVQNQKPRMYYSHQGKVCDYVLKLPKCNFDVGFDKQEDGSYAPMFDEHANYVGSQIGATCPMPDSQEGRAQRQLGRLLQHYQKHVAINTASLNGLSFMGQTIDAATGDFQLQFMQA
jgi:hypothetical protein